MPSLRAGATSGHAGIFTGRYMPYDAVAASTIPPDLGWHTYRVEVRGDALRFLVDGNQVAATESSLASGNRRLGIFADDAQIIVRAFKVITSK